jgi:hypothetical protein
VSIPSIPSRFLQPNLDEPDEIVEQTRTIQAQKNLNPMVKMLVDDKGQLGPGAYENDRSSPNKKSAL